jgi:cytochrome c553
LLQPVKRMVDHVASLWSRTWHYFTGGSHKRALLGVTIMACTFAAGGFLYVWLGLVPVAASEGHWRITNWFLRFAMRNSVELSSMGIKPPPLDDPALVLKAAGHYATGCAPCHGAPGEPQSPIVEQMVPRPPSLPSRIRERKPGQLFWIVKHGIKYTAMPGWVALEREDEIWAMVAFMLQLSELSPGQYRYLAYGEDVTDASVVENDTAPYLLRPLAESLELILADCARCHGADGNGRSLGAFPKLAGQSEVYLLASLRAFAKGERHSGIMQPVAAGLNEESLHALARYYSGLAKLVPAGLTRDSTPPADIERGRKIVEVGVPEQGIPSCIDCHGPRSTPRNPIYPDLAGQYADYLVLQLKLFQSGTRGGTTYAHIMNTIARRMTEEQILDVARYYAAARKPDRGDASLPP